MLMEKILNDIKQPFFSVFIILSNIAFIVIGKESLLKYLTSVFQFVSTLIIMIVFLYALDLWFSQKNKRLYIAITDHFFEKMKNISKFFPQLIVFLSIMHILTVTYLIIIKQIELIVIVKIFMFNILIATIEETVKWFYYELYIYYYNRIDPLISLLIVNMIWTLFHITQIGTAGIIKLLIIFLIGLLIFAIYQEYGLYRVIITHFFFNTVLLLVAYI